MNLLSWIPFFAFFIIILIIYFDYLKKAEKKENDIDKPIPEFFCFKCKREFKNQKALAGHLRHCK